jgi:hypothetical protein
MPFSCASAPRRGHQIAAVAVAHKLTVLCWHLLTKGEDYLWARPALVANKTRAMRALSQSLSLTLMFKAYLT